VLQLQASLRRQQRHRRLQPTDHDVSPSLDDDAPSIQIRMSILKDKPLKRSYQFNSGAPRVCNINNEPFSIAAGLSATPGCGQGGMFSLTKI